MLEVVVLCTWQVRVWSEVLLYWALCSWLEYRRLMLLCLRWLQLDMIVRAWAGTLALERHVHHARIWGVEGWDECFLEVLPLVWHFTILVLTWTWTILFVSGDVEDSLDIFYEPRILSVPIVLIEYTLCVVSSWTNLRRSCSIFMTEYRILESVFSRTKELESLVFMANVKCGELLIAIVLPWARYFILILCQVLSNYLLLQALVFFLFRVVHVIVLPNTCMRS